MTKVCLSWQNVCHNKIMFIVTVLCGQTYFCHDKRCFAVTNTFVATKSFSWQNFDHKHTSVAIKDVFCHDKNTCGSSHQWQVSATYSKDRYWSVRLTSEGDLETHLASYSKDRHSSVKTDIWRWPKLDFLVTERDRHSSVRLTSEGDSLNLLVTARTDLCQTDIWRWPKLDLLVT